MSMEPLDMKTLLSNAYKKLESSKKRQIKWPSGILAFKEANTITLKLDETATKQNMQTDGNAFESWILALVALSEVEKCFRCNYTVNFHEMTKPLYSSSNPEKQELQERRDWQNYQRLLFRIKLFEELFGRKWFSITDKTKSIIEKDCLYYNAESLVINTGSVGRDNPPTTDNEDGLSESQLEWDLCKNGDYKTCIPDAFKTGPVYRQFPIGIFENKVSKVNSIFPRGKACIDLVANGNDGNSFWIFELKKHLDSPALGIISELLFYAAIVRDMVAGNIKGKDPKDDHCYKLSWLNNNTPQKSIINACFLAPNYHPLFFEGIITILNEAFSSSSASDKHCSVIFHKPKFDISNGNRTIIKD